MAWHYMVGVWYGMAWHGRVWHGIVGVWHHMHMVGAGYDRVGAG